MASEGERQSVFRTTKVRTALKGDSSWINRRSAPQEEKEEKPWVSEPCPSISHFCSEPQAIFRIPDQRGFHKNRREETNFAITSNGSSPSSSFIPKKPSDSYKRIAPHSVRSVPEVAAPVEPTLSPEEQEKRTEAASKVLRTSASRQRSYVLSAAKKYETSDNAESPLSPTSRVSPSFLAKRVEINDDEENTPTVTQNDVAPRVPTPEATPTSPAVDTLMALSDTLISTDTPSTVETQKSSPPPTPSVPDSTEDVKPAPDEETETVSVPVVVSQVEVEPSPEPAQAPVPEQAPEPIPEPAPAQPPTPEPASEPAPAPPSSDSLDNDDLFALTESTETSVDPLPTSTDLLSNDLLTGPDSQSEQTPQTLDDLAFDVIPIDTSRTSLSTDLPSEEPSQAPTEQPADTQSATDQKTSSDDLINIQSETSLIDSFDPIPVETSPTKSSAELISLLQDSDTIKGTEDSSTEPLLPLSSGSREDSLSGNALDALADDVIPINTNTRSLSDAVSSDSKSEELLTTEEESPEQSVPSWSRWRTPVQTFEETETTEESAVEPESPPPASLDSSRALESARQELSPPDSPESKKNFVYVKEYVNSELAKHNSHNGGDDHMSSSTSNYSYSSPTSGTRGNMVNCTYCGQVVGSEGRITIEDLNIFCHPGCFKCGVCSRPMGDLLYSMFLHGGVVHCESCYSNVL
ncbi:hypothetical protein AGOR_G00077760 [Albula goreensis]|uniref:LIM zinc-binding domain-containing protein n=1 Tax=Albula goreensis TaxID=1534307 RepID=A0A8T3DRT2_9TELE|nr:hypothetical protein AGOR_G00077760 [Albula goreensis]